MDDHRRSEPRPDEKDDAKDEEVIDLTSVVKAEVEEEIIDLNEVMGPAANATDDSSDDVIPLLEVVPEDAPDAPLQKTDEVVIDLTEVADEDTAQPVSAGAPPSETMDRSGMPGGDAMPAPPSSTEMIVTETQLEEALTRVVEKIYGEKIEQLLIQTIENTVLQEIERIRHTLLSDGDP